MMPPLEFTAPVWALIREVPDSFSACLRSEQLPLDPERARSQVHAYARALADCGVVVQRLPGDEACPDACFIEDTAVILDAATALMTRPGAPSRRPEVAPVAQALEGLLTRMVTIGEAAATLDGGDVLRVGELLLVGLSTRSNAAGAEALAALARPLGLRVKTVEVAAGLHLKSAVTLLASDRLVALEGIALPRDPALEGKRVIFTDEPAGANVLALGRQVLVSDAAPQTLARLARESDLEILRLDVSELHKADGALTCLSLRIPAPDTWCA